MHYVLNIDLWLKITLYNKLLRQHEYIHDCHLECIVTVHGADVSLTQMIHAINKDRIASGTSNVGRVHTRETVIHIVASRIVSYSCVGSAPLEQAAGICKHSIGVETVGDKERLKGICWQCYIGRG